MKRIVARIPFEQDGCAFTDEDLKALIIRGHAIGLLGIPIDKIAVKYDSKENEYVVSWFEKWPKSLKDKLGI